MKTFLEEVATDLYQKYGETNELYNITIVTPSKRSKLFLNKYFAKLANGRPLWSPQYINTLQLCSRSSELLVIDNDGVQRVSLVWELYNTYKTVRQENGLKETESFDEFYFFGEILLNDFNIIDKQLVNAENLFSNISELHRVEDWSFLSEEQKIAIKKFFNYDINSKLQSNFFDIWKILFIVYERFKGTIEKKGISYEGMMLRYAVEQNIDADKFFTSDKEKFAFVGYYKFTEAEKKLLEIVKHKSLFYWDYDEYYINSNIGLPIKENIRLFSNELVNSDNNNFIKGKTIEYIEAANFSLQTGYIPSWLGDTDDFDSADTAIVLCDAKLLPVTLSQLPETIVPNVAILYTLMQSQVASLVILLAELQTKGVRRDGFDLAYLMPVLNNAYIQGIYPHALIDKDHILQTKRMMIKSGTTITIAEKYTITVLTDDNIFCVADKPKSLLYYIKKIIETIAESKTIVFPLEINALSETYKMLNGLEDIVEHVSNNLVFYKIIKRILLSIKISYSGEPAKGLQVMGMSDTRNMDFKNVFLLSANDGILPKIEPEASFIPPFLRKAFGLPSVEEQDTEAAYYFYHLIQRATNISISYNIGKNATSKGEMSRYLLQMQWESPHKNNIRRKSINNDVQKELNVSIFDEVCKTGHIIDSLSPSAFNCYLDCSMQFYFRYIKKIKKPDDNDLNNAIMGNIFHKAMELIYKGKKIIDVDFFSKYIDINTKKLKEHTQEIIIEAFKCEFFKVSTKIDDYNGEQIIFYNVICQMVKNTLLYDYLYSPFTILGIEEKCEMIVDINGSKIVIGGIIDRIDIKDNKIRVVDYKTGSIPNNNDFSKDIENIFNEKRKIKAGYQFQIFLYSSVLCRKESKHVKPILFYPLAANNPILQLNSEPIEDFSQYADDFLSKLKEKISELLDQSIPFVKRKQDNVCLYCEYSELCGRSNY